MCQQTFLDFIASYLFVFFPFLVVFIIYYVKKYLRKNKFKLKEFVIWILILAFTFFVSHTLGKIFRPGC